MAGRGPAPKPSEQRRRRNAETVSGTHLIDDGFELGPSIEQATGKQIWIPQVLAWWKTWQTSPQAKSFIATDWQRLAFLAPLVELYWQEPDKNLLSEIRLNEERLGATVVDRQRARMTIEESKEQAQVISIAGSAARERIAKRNLNK